MTYLSLSFREWSYPTKHRGNECCAWGECGFLAYSLGNSVSIYSNEIGRFSPMYMWSPFEHDITCMGWCDGSCTPSIVQPLLAIANIRGRLAVFDVRNKGVFGKASFKGDVPKSIVWSPFYRSRFYVGTKNGFLNCMQMDEKLQPNIAILAEINLEFSVDFIATDPQTGTTVAAASKNGQFAIISSILSAKSTDKYRSFSLNINPEKDSITTLSFFPDHSNFLILSTERTSYLFSIKEEVTLPYIPTEGIRFISSPSKSTNRIIIGYDSAISLWQYNNDGWVRLSITTFSPLKGMRPEAKMYTSLDDKVIVFSETNWLTVIEEHHNKLFVAQRIRMMPSKPLDWDFRKGSIAFANSCGSVMVTSWTPDAVIQPKCGFGEAVSMDDLKSVEPALDAEAGTNQFFVEDMEIPSSPDSHIDFPSNNTNRNNFNNFKNGGNFNSNANVSNSRGTRGVNFGGGFAANTKPTFSQLMEANDLEVDIEQGEFEDAFDFSTSFVSIPASHMKNKELVKSITKNKEKFSKVWKNIKDEGSSPDRNKPFLTLPAEVNISDDQSSPLSGDYTPQSVLCGNSNTLLLSFKVAPFALNHVMWGPGGRLIVWTYQNNKNTLELVDFKKRETKTLLAMQLNAISVPITTIFFSEDRSLFCIIIDDLTALFMTTSATPKQIGSLTFNSKVIGSFGPNGYDCVFISKDSIFYNVTINEKEGAIITKTYRFPSKRGEPTFISWHISGVIIGTALGKVSMYFGKNFKEYKNIISITNPVKQVYQCDNNSYLIVDNQQNAVLHKTLEDVPLKGKVKNIKLASPDTFLVKFKGSGKLTVFSSTEKFTPLPPPCVSRCPLVQEPARYQRELGNLKMNSPEEAIKACRLFGAIFIMRLILAKQNPNMLSEHVSWLNGLISGCVQFSSWAIRLALQIGDSATARNLLLMTSPSSPDYIQNMTKAALFDTVDPGDSIETVAKALFDSGRNDEATDILLITGAVNIAVNRLISQGNLRDSAMLLRMRRDKGKNVELYHSVANKLIEQRSLMLGLIMLSEGGFNGEMVGLISSIIGVEFSHLLSFLDEDDIHY